MRLLIFLLLLLFSISAFSQRTDSLKRLYVNQTVYRYGTDFMKGTEKLKFGDLKNEFSSVGLDNYELAKRRRTTSVVLNALSLVAGITGLRLLSGNNSTPVYICFGAQLGFALAGSYYKKLYTQDLDKAIWQRNKDLLFGQ